MVKLDVIHEVDYSVKGKQGVFNNIWTHFIANKGHPGFRVGAANGRGLNVVSVYGFPGEKARDPIGIFDTSGRLGGAYGSVLDVAEMRPVDLMIVFKGFNIDFYNHTDLDFLWAIQQSHDCLARLYRESPGFYKHFRIELLSVAREFNLKLTFAMENH